MKRLVPSAVLVSMLLASSSALALTDEQKQNLKSLDYYKSQVDLKNRPFRDGQSDSDVSSALYGYETKLKTVKERLDKIPAADRKDPMYESYASWANEFESTLKRWQGERATNAQNLKNKAQAEEIYKNETREIGDGLEDGLEALPARDVHGTGASHPIARAAVRRGIPGVIRSNGDGRRQGSTGPYVTTPPGAGSVAARVMVRESSCAAPRSPFPVPCSQWCSSTAVAAAR